MYVKRDEMDEDWKFPAGVMLFETAPTLVGMNISPFREETEYSSVFKSVWTKYLPTLAHRKTEEEVSKIKELWEKRIKMLIDLDPKNYVPFNINDLRPQKPFAARIDVRHTPPRKDAALTATFFPVEPSEFIVGDLKKDDTIVFYTKEKSRPWIGLVMEITDGSLIVQWVKKVQSHYILDYLPNGSPYTSSLPMESVLFSDILQNQSSTLDRRGPYKLDPDVK